ncbi:unnamed protein product [Schistocephalus solidus]|uniref:Uncharacterized protein n=1 Tax=Schistocephalus solidus TaxID=70667 RepID=A0A183T1X6_SCHSO|nr:unnamed protein product [Schistocephalus solidus]
MLQESDDSPIRAQNLIKKSKEKFKAALLSESDMLKRRICQILQDLQSTGPFAAAIKPDEALDTCKGYRDCLAATLEREAELRRGLMLFKIEQPPCKETILIERVSNLPSKCVYFILSVIL